MSARAERKRRETPAEKRERLEAELEAAERESRPPQYGPDDVTAVIDLGLERARRIADLAGAEGRRSSEELNGAVNGLRRPRRGRTDVIKGKVK